MSKNENLCKIRRRERENRNAEYIIYGDKLLPRLENILDETYGLLWRRGD
jgi:hypothetical protein